jgi:hypothetical protein
MLSRHAPARTGLDTSVRPVEASGSAGSLRHIHGGLCRGQPTRTPAAGSVRWGDLPAHYTAGDVYAIAPYPAPWPGRRRARDRLPRGLGDRAAGARRRLRRRPGRSQGRRGRPRGERARPGRDRGSPGKPAAGPRLGRPDGRGPAGPGGALVPGHLGRASDQPVTPGGITVVHAASGWRRRAPTPRTAGTG